MEFGNLQKPTTFGNEYLTYILWAISPEGRAVNLGEILVGDNHRSKVDVTTDLQAFALIVTAEPYYAVRQPSNVVVIENVVRDDTKGTIEAMHTKYELLERGGYIPTGYKFDPVVLNTKLPLEFFEARNALRIAQSEGAETYAKDSYQHAVQLMDQADSVCHQQAHRQKSHDRGWPVKQFRPRKMPAPSPSRRSKKSVWPTNVRLLPMPRHKLRQKRTRLRGRRNEHKSDQARAENARDRAESDTAKSPGRCCQGAGRFATAPGQIWRTARLPQPVHFPQRRPMRTSPV